MFPRRLLPPIDRCTASSSSPSSSSSTSSSSTTKKPIDGKKRYLIYWGSNAEANRMAWLATRGGRTWTWTWTTQSGEDDSFCWHFRPLSCFLPSLPLVEEDECHRSGAAKKKLLFLRGRQSSFAFLASSDFVCAREHFPFRAAPLQGPFGRQSSVFPFSFAHVFASPDESAAAAAAAEMASSHFLFPPHSVHSGGTPGLPISTFLLPAEGGKGDAYLYTFPASRRHSSKWKMRGIRKSG